MKLGDDGGLAKMAMPDYQSIYYPFLRSIEDGKEHSIREMIENLSRCFDITDEEKKERLPNGKQGKFENRVRWAQMRLKKAELLETTGWGKFKITDLGHDILKFDPSKFNDKFIMEFSDSGTNGLQYTEEINNGEKADKPPEEVLEETHEELRKQLAQELLERIMDCSPQFFENLVVDLLVAMGYGGSRKDAGQAVGRSSDGGIDGIIKEDRLGLDAVYIQAKRWQTTVGSPTVREFAGSLMGQNARKGVLITTSQFSNEAKAYVCAVPQTKIVLIDGEQLAQLMIDHDIGVADVATYRIKKADLDYFGEF
ncbi:MAG TPA: restriction endonuclease [Methanothrix sp.]|nr:restriction endonuclease [Methanothrix sp.]